MKKYIHSILLYAAVGVTSCNPINDDYSDLDAKNPENHKSPAYSTDVEFQDITAAEKFVFKNYPDGWFTEIKDSIFIINHWLSLDSLILRQYFSYEHSQTVSFDYDQKWILSSYMDLSVEGCLNIDGTRSYFICTKDSLLFSGHDIYEIFELKKDSNPLQVIPIMRGRINKWFIITPDSTNLFVKHINSYPDGNQKCYYYEKQYHFIMHND